MSLWDEIDLNMNLQKYMSDAIRRIMAKAYRNVLSNPREAKTIFR